MAHPDRFLLAGVMGWPVMHSRSPMLHNYWFGKHKLAGTYVPLAIRPEGLAAALRALHPLGFAGCNLTIPHKEQAMAIVDEVDALAKAIGAISCVVVRPDGSLAGTNNDCYGFIQNVTQEQPGWRGRGADRGDRRGRRLARGVLRPRAGGRARDPARQPHVRPREGHRQ
jgi:shikimate dehydrogenase